MFVKLLSCYVFGVGLFVLFFGVDFAFEWWFGIVIRLFGVVGEVVGYLFGLVGCVLCGVGCIVL